MNNRIKILDCTLRDGGLGLEDAYKNKIANMEFVEADIDDVISLLQKSQIDIIELGSIEITEDDKRGFAIYPNIQEISKKIPTNRNANQMYVGLYRGPDTPVDEIPEWNPTLVDGVRVIIRYSEMQKSLDFCANLAQKGYKVFVQPMLTMRYSNEELALIVREANRMGAYAVYFVDSYGYMESKDVIHYLEFFDKNLNDDINIGFHAHNNMNLAYANALTFIEYPTNRKLIVDACAIGMGQGAGNLQTELIADYINKANDDKYDFSAILDVCEVIDKYYGTNMWGYSVTRVLPALHKVAYKYAISLRYQYGFSYSQINKILENIPSELKHRYTIENIERLLKDSKENYYR